MFTHQDSFFLGEETKSGGCRYIIRVRVRQKRFVRRAPPNNLPPIVSSHFYETHHPKTL